MGDRNAWFRSRSPRQILRLNQCRKENWPNHEITFNLLSETYVDIGHIPVSNEREQSEYTVSFQIHYVWSDMYKSNQSFECSQHILKLTLVLLLPEMACLYKQCRFISVGFWRSQLIWICTVCHQYVILYQQRGSSNLFGWQLEKDVSS